ncbi:MAG: hypothetical protein A2010_00925 [Nitrospirae bacterium GWD2_57_9]|nr:MAG: hypothetical protein A2010_00925 [Nitrospirae bacterium GWD2_57_9]
MPKYELAVVGAGLGGLSAAAIASKMNKKTIVLEPGTSVGGSLRSYEKNGFRFSPGPVLSFGFDREGIFQQLSETLGITLAASLCAPCYQVALPDRRITIYADRTETLDELRREFPQEIDSIIRFYSDLRKQAVRISKSRISAFFSNSRSAGGFIQSYDFSNEFKAFLDAQAFYFFRQPAASLALHSLLIVCDSIPSVADGGFGKVAAQLLDVLLRNQGEIRYEVLLSETGMSAHSLSTPEGMLEAGTILFNTDQGNPRSFICVGLPEKAIPVGMLREVIVVPDYAHPEHFFTLSLSSKDDETTAPRGMRALTATFSDASESASLESRMRQIEGIMPFLAEYALFAEGHRPASNRFSFTESTSLKTVKKIDRMPVLYRSSEQSAYVLFDGATTPAQTVAAARSLVERIT